MVQFFNLPHWCFWKSNAYIVCIFTHCHLVKLFIHACSLKTSAKFNTCIIQHNILKKTRMLNLSAFSHSFILIVFPQLTTMGMRMPYAFSHTTTWFIHAFKSHCSFKRSAKFNTTHYTILKKTRMLNLSAFSHSFILIVFPQLTTMGMRMPYAFSHTTTWFIHALFV